MAAAPKANATAFIDVDPTDERFWVTRWRTLAGAPIHGGRHFLRADAELHAESLNAASADDYAAWLEMHDYGDVREGVA